MKSKQDIADLMEFIFKDLQATREAGQKEYAHSSDNAFGNFERLAVLLQMERKKVLWTYVQKHIDGVISFLNGHKSQREDVRGRIKDIMVYLVLLWGMIDDDEAAYKSELVAKHDAKYAETTQSVNPDAKCHNCTLPAVNHVGPQLICPNVSVPSVYRFV